MAGTRIMTGEHNSSSQYTDLRYRQFLDSSGNALTLIFCFTDILPDGGGTAIAEDGISGESETVASVEDQSVYSWQSCASNSTMHLKG